MRFLSFIPGSLFIVPFPLVEINWIIHTELGNGSITPLGTRFDHLLSLLKPGPLEVELGHSFMVTF
jgi:hypothetical protein